MPPFSFLSNIIINQHNLTLLFCISIKYLLWQLPSISDMRYAPPNPCYIFRNYCPRSSVRCASPVGCVRYANPRARLIFSHCWYWWWWGRRGRRRWHILVVTRCSTTMVSTFVKPITPLWKNRILNKRRIIQLSNLFLDILIYVACCNSHC